MREAHRRRMTGQLPQLLHFHRPPRRHSVANILEDEVRRDRVEFYVATCWQEGEGVTYLRHQRPATSTEERAEATVEPKLLAVMANEIEHRANRLADAPPQPTPKLLEEESWTVCGTEEQERVDDGHVDALVEQV